MLHARADASPRQARSRPAASSASSRWTATSARCPLRRPPSLVCTPHHSFSERRSFFLTLTQLCNTTIRTNTHTNSQGSRALPAGPRNQVAGYRRITRDAHPLACPRVCHNPHLPTHALRTQTLYQHGTTDANVLNRTSSLTFCASWCRACHLLRPPSRPSAHARASRGVHRPRARSTRPSGLLMLPPAPPQPSGPTPPPQRSPCMSSLQQQQHQQQQGQLK